MKNQYLKAIFLSFYSASIYKTALTSWRGYGLRYLLIVTLLTSTFISIGWIIDIKKIDPGYTADIITGFILSEPDLSFEENLNRFFNILHQIPDIKIENSTAITDVSQPYKIIDPISSYDIAIIDTTGKYKSLAGSEAMVLLTDKRLIISNDRGVETVIHLNDFEKRYNIDNATINETLSVIGQVPQFSLHDGKFITDDNKLYTIVDTKGREIAEIGPGAKINKNNFEPMLAISTDEIAFKSILNKEGTYINAKDLNEQTLFELIKSVIASVKNIVLWGLPFIAFPFIVLTSFLFSAIMLVLYSFIGYSFIKMMKLGQFEYKQIMRIAVIAITPVLIISVILPQILPSQGTIYFLVSIGYLYYAIKSVTVRQ